MPSSALPASAHHGSATPRPSWFNFRSERATWLSVLAIVIAIAAFIFATIYAVDTYRLAKWTSEKDYQMYCQSLLSTSQPLPADCVPIVQAALPAPPSHSADYFAAFVNNIKRSMADHRSQGDTDNGLPTTLRLIAAMDMSVLVGVSYCCLKAVFDRLQSEHWPYSYSGRMVNLTPPLLGPFSVATGTKNDACSTTTLLFLLTSSMFFLARGLDFPTNTRSSEAFQARFSAAFSWAVLIITLAVFSTIQDMTRDFVHPQQKSMAAAFTSALRKVAKYILAMLACLLICLATYREFQKANTPAIGLSNGQSDSSSSKSTTLLLTFLSILLNLGLVAVSIGPSNGIKQLYVKYV